MDKIKLQAGLLAIGASLMCANTMAMSNSAMSNSGGNLLIFEGGLSYSHANYKGSFTPAESHTPITPAGFSIHPSDFYPNNFWGGYIGLSLYVPAGWLINTRYDSYGSESKTNSAAGTTISFAPARFAFTADKVGGCIDEFSYGLGAGAVFESTNKGDATIVLSGDNPLSESIAGRTRIDPMVEGFLMYRFNNNVGIKLNAAYQLAINNDASKGDLNLNLGINYALPI